MQNASVHKLSSISPRISRYDGKGRKHIKHTLILTAAETVRASKYVFPVSNVISRNNMAVTPCIYRHATPFRRTLYICHWPRFRRLALKVLYVSYHTLMVKRWTAFFGLVMCIRHSLYPVFLLSLIWLARFCTLTPFVSRDRSCCYRFVVRFCGSDERSV